MNDELPGSCPPRAPEAPRVGIVIVSHSPKVAEGAVDMVLQMVGDRVPVAGCGGDPGGGLGTSVEAIQRAIEAVWSETGVAVLVDLGGAQTNAEMAIELLEPDRRERIAICDAPLVEGAVIAATEAACGSSLTAVCRAAGGADGGGILDQALRASIPLANPIGLHARPSVALTRLARRFDARIELALAPEGPWIDAGSPLRVMRLRARQGQDLHIRAQGPEAAVALEAMLNLVRQGFRTDDG